MLFLQSNLFAENIISYIYQDVSVDSIHESTIKWQELKEPIYNGFDNGIYWFKIELEPSDEDRVLTIPESHISRANLYLGNDELIKNDRARFVSFRIKRHHKKQIYHLRVNCLLEAHIPIEIRSVDVHYANETKVYIFLALYFGIVIAILLFNLFSYLNQRDIIYIHYIIVCLGMVMTPFYKEGLSALVFELNGINETLEASFPGLIVIGGIFLTASYFNLDKEKPKVWKLSIYITAIAFLACTIYYVTHNFIFFVASHVLYIIVLDIFVISAIMLWRKSAYARFFAIAYSIPLITAHELFVSPYFALPLLNLPPVAFKIGSAIEMIIFSYAITLKTKHLIEENNSMRMQLLEFTQQLKTVNKGVSERLDTTKELIETFNLTIKEIKVLKTLSLNKTNKEIAEIEFISENTVKYHIKNICKKLDVKSKKDAMHHYLNPGER